MKYAFVVLLLFLLAAIPAVAETPKTATAATKYGPFKFWGIEIIRAEKDRPCGLVAKVENRTGTTWDNPVFSVKVSGLAPGGRRQSFEIEAGADYIGNVLDVDHVTGKCLTDHPEISVDKIAISLTGGQPDLEIAKLPLVNSGAPTAFVGSDRKCAEQFQQALTMQGLEKRKRLAALIAYGCGFIADSPVRAEILQKDGNLVLVKLSGKHDGESGWVPVAWVK